jgi:phenylacetate-CoA ligase
VNPWVARNLVYRPATWLRGEPVFRLLRQYDESQWLPAEKIAAAQEEAVAQILRHAASSTAHYGKLVRQAGLDPARVDAKDLACLPVLTKLDLVERSHHLQAPLRLGTTSWKTTGGSTGVPVRLRKDRLASAAEQAASWRSYGWFGIRPGDRQARFWGTPQTTRARVRYGAIDLVLNRNRFSAFAFRREDLGRYFARVARTRPTWVYGYVSMLVQFARHCLDEGLPLAGVGVRAVVTTSEVLTPGDRALLREAFAAPVQDEYGCGEVGAVLYECERGTMHLMAENLFVELLPDPTPEQPRAARLVVTDLHNRATPLLRYDLGDRVVPAPPCACGRGLPSFSSVFGRAYDFVETSDGTRYHGEFFLYVLESARDRGLAVQQVQFVQRAPDHLEILLVPGTGGGADAGPWMAEELARRTEGRLRVTGRRVDSIAREASGKIRLIRVERGSVPGASARE